MEEMFALRDEILTRQPEVWPVLEKAVNNGGNRQAGELVEIFKAFERAVRTLRRFGCELKGVRQGLVDFPALRDGREVYLCWQYDEPEIAFWHEVDAGFAGRQPL